MSNLTHLYQRREWAGPRELRRPRRVSYRLRWQERVMIVALFMAALLGLVFFVAVVTAAAYLTLLVLKGVMGNA